MLGMRAKGIQGDTKGLRGYKWVKGIQANEEVQDYRPTKPQECQSWGKVGRAGVTEDFLPVCCTLQGCPNFLQVYAFS